MFHIIFPKIPSVYKIGQLIKKCKIDINVLKLLQYVESIFVCNLHFA